MFDVPDSAENALSTAWTPPRSVESQQQSVARPAVTRSAAEASAAKFVAPQTPAAEPLAPNPSAPRKKCPEALADEITTLAGHLNAAQHRFLKLLDEFDRHQGWAGPGIRSLAHWLNWKCGIGDLAAREKVRVARALRELPEIDAAFERREVLNIGRRSRTVPWRIAHALRIRDGGCRFPGCGQRRWTDAHHIRHWADGGGTSLENLVTLCRHHHRSLHREEYRIERGASGELTFIDAQYQSIPPAIHPQFEDRPGSGGAAGTEVATSAADRVERLQAENRGRGVEIDESTAVTRWGGESMDYSTAIEWLLYKDGVTI